MASSSTLAANLQALPSIFEINAAEYLDRLLYPALSKLFDFFNWRYTLKWKNFYFSDNFSPILVTVLQYFYLHNQNSSFGECFYSVKRTSELSFKALTNYQKFSSMLFLVFLPYYEKKLKDRDYEHMSTKFDKHMLNSIKLLNCTKVIYMMAYLAKFTNIHCPIFKLLGLRLQYKPPLQESRTTYILLKSMEFGAFLLQFIQWWHARKDSSTEGIGQLQNPRASSNSDANKSIKTVPGLCPICLQNIRIPTASRVSGYVYCFKCISNHIQSERSCPCTGYPMNVEDLIQIHNNED